MDSLNYTHLGNPPFTSFVYTTRMEQPYRHDNFR